MKKTSLFLLYFFVSRMCLLSQGLPVLSSAEIYTDIEKLQQFGSVLYLAAHPDDENTRVISFLSQGRHYRVGYLSLTRGDGGQNLIGDEQGEELGVIRSQELIAARKIDKADQFFTRAYDFGFSKNPEETFQKWDRETLLHDVVWIIRKYKPDVIISRFPTTGEGGHGHHTASAMLAVDAYTAAADPQRFPEQLTNVTPWKAHKLLWNSYQFGDVNTISPKHFSLHAGGYDPLKGLSYGEIAALSRSRHSSQGFGTPLNRKDFPEYFAHWAGGIPQFSLMDGVDTTWQKCIPNPQKATQIAQSIQLILEQFDFKKPYESIPKLVKVKQLIESVPEAFVGENAFYTKQKLADLNTLIIKCAGIFCSVTSSEPYLVPGEKVNLKLQIDVRFPFKGPFVLKTMKQDPMEKVIHSRHWDSNFTFTVPTIDQESQQHLAINGGYLAYGMSHPYWLKGPITNDLFAPQSLELLGLPENPPLFKAAFYLDFPQDGFSVFLEPPWQHYQLNPSSGEEYQPLFITPPAVILPDKKVQFLTIPHHINRTDFTHREYLIQVTIKSMTDEVSGKLKAVLPEGWTHIPPKNNPECTFSLPRKNGEATIPFTVSIPSQAFKAIKDSGMLEEHIRFFIEDQKGRTYDHSFVQFPYTHIPHTRMLPKADVAFKGIPIDEKWIQRIGKVGYISGSGDKVLACLQDIGIHVDLLLPSDLTNAQKLSRYSTIIVGIRAFNVKQELKSLTPYLWEYVENGGRLLVQYQTNNRLAPIDVSIGPYPMDISRNRVTVEDAPVRILSPMHPLMNHPFKIQPSDFDDWVQERGVYFAGSFDQRYTPLLEMNDPGESALNGSLITAEYGKGRFIYTGLSFFRQLPAGVPGAYTLFFNLMWNQQVPHLTPHQEETTTKKSNRKKPSTDASKKY
jgi:LmbE family N-acetylglucosaminyl deacetylase